MERRSAIKLSLGSIGLCLSGIGFSSLMYACKTDLTASDWMPKTFSPGEAQLVERLCDIIIPATKRGPGAAEAMVHRYLDEAVGNYFSIKEKEEFLSLLNEVDAYAEKQYSKVFMSLERQQQEELVQYWADSSDDFTPSRNGEQHSFIFFRELVKHAFFTSEVGCKEVLNYDPVPGSYQGCIGLPENGAAWAGLAG
jgi:hypothetical protein